MRIGFFDPYLDTLSGGEKYILTAASFLSRKHRVDVFWDDKSILDGAEKKLHIDTSRVNIVQDIFSDKFSGVNKLWETRKYDRLFVLSDGSIPVTLAKKTFLHFQFPVEWVRAGGLKTRIKLLKIDNIICNSVFTKNFIDKKFEVKSEVIYPPCLGQDEIKNFSDADGGKGKKNIILTVGRYSPLRAGVSVKKLEVMIEAFKKMIDEGLRHWEFLAVVSFFPENKKYIEEIEQSVKSYPVRFLKNIDFEELTKVYGSAKIYWHAAGFGEDMKEHPEKTEHFGITTVEAMAHGVVPVVINAGGQPEIVGNKIDGFLWDNLDEMQMLTKRLMLDEKLRAQMAGMAVEKAGLFTSEKFGAAIENMFK